MLLTFRDLNSIAPKYLQDLLQIMNLNATCDLRTRVTSCKAKNRAAAGGRAFCNAAPGLCQIKFVILNAGRFLLQEKSSKNTLI